MTDIETDDPPPEVAALTVPTPPAPDGIITSQWGLWVQNHQTTPARFALWRASASLALGTDGANNITFDSKDDPLGMCDTASTFKAPASGVVAFSAALLFAFGGSVTTMNAYAVLTVAGGGEVRRGNQLNTSAAVPQFGSVLSGIGVVTAGTVYGLTGFASAAGMSKSVFGGRALCYLEGVYLTAF